MTGIRNGLRTMSKRTGKPHGVRYTKHQTEACRAKIKTTAILNRLQRHLEGKLELSPTQVRCAEIMLNKSLANLTATELSGDVASFVMRLPEPATDMAAWQRSNSVAPSLPHSSEHKLTH
jgi:predicted component of type VI protein secretion system